jgi:hypothetical protein
MQRRQLQLQLLSLLVRRPLLLLPLLPLLLLL